MAHKEQANVIGTRLSSSLQQAMDLNSETGSSSWLTVLPLQDQVFHLHKQEFWDGLNLRYGWKLADTPGHCKFRRPLAFEVYYTYMNFRRTNFNFFDKRVLTDHQWKVLQTYVTLPQTGLVKFVMMLP